MKGLFKKSLVVALALFTRGSVTNAAPIPSAGIETIEPEFEHDYLRELAGFDERRRALMADNERRSLASQLDPILQLLGPLFKGLGKGVSDGASEVHSAVDDVGSAVKSAAYAVGVVGENTLHGTAGTVVATPQAVYDTVKAVEKGGLAGSIVNVLTGAPKDD